MEYDALQAGVNRGGLISTDEIKILICYIMSSISDPMPCEGLSELLHHAGLANFFEVAAAFTDLASRGLITETEPDSGRFLITSTGRDVASTLKTSVSKTVREKAYSLAVKMITRLRYIEETKIDVTPLSNGFDVRCAVIEDSHELMSVSVFVADEAQVENIKSNFLEDPTSVYYGMIELLTKASLS